MGFGSIIATGITAIILIVTGYLIIAALTYSVDTATAAQAAVTDAAEGRMRTSLAISGVSRADDHRLDFTVTNDGGTAIDDVTRMDVFVLATSGGRCTSCDYLPYHGGGAGAPSGYWHAAGGATTLAPGDSLAIQCAFASPLPSSQLGYIEVAAPNGVMVYQSYKY